MTLGPRTYAAITTCNAAGWALYGRRMAQSFVALWPKEIQLTVFAENFVPDVEGILVDNLPQWMYNFKSRHVHDSRPNGYVTKEYNFRFDAVRFVHKAAAVIEAHRTQEEDILIWIDADTVTHSPIPMSFIESLLPESHSLAWLDRGAVLYPECGFYMLDCLDPNLGHVMEDWTSAYHHDSLFNFTEWHDSWVFAELVHRRAVRWVSISGPLLTHHPFINGPLGQYMDHLKGPRKMVGRSKPTDLKVERCEPYWRK